jgi:hypothetical protein
MERVAFILDADGRRLDCLLNPESLRLLRRAGVAARVGHARPITAARLRDDPLLFTGGGVTELELELLFDTSLRPAPHRVEDVRELTRPLWELAEGGAPASPTGAPSLVRFVWGKHWNVPGVVLAVAERLERFTPAGAPGRSWLHLRLRRLAPPVDRHVDVETMDASRAEAARAAMATTASSGPTGATDARHEVAGDAARLDEIAARHYGNPALWRLLAAHNGVDDPSALAAGTVLRIPAAPSGRGGP